MNSTATLRFAFFLSLYVASPLLWVSAQELSDAESVRSKSSLLYFQQYTVSNGLSSNEVSAIIQDKDGFIWMGTEDGLNQFDGYQFSVYKYDPDNPISLSDNIVLTLVIGSDSVLYVGTVSGLNLFDPKTRRVVRFLNDPEDSTSISHNSVEAIFEDSEGRIWIGTRNGLNLFDAETGFFTRYKHEPGNPYSISHNEVWSIVEDPFQSGSLWVGTRDGLNRLDTESGEFTRYVHDASQEGGVSDNRVRSLHVGGTIEPILWVGTHNGLLRYNPEQDRFSVFYSEPGNPHSLSNPIIEAIYTDEHGDVWVGTRHGLNRFLSDSLGFAQFFHNSGDPRSLVNDEIWDITSDRTGGIWVATQGGVSRFENAQFTVRQFENDADDPGSLSHNEVQWVYEDQAGFIWAGTRNGLNRIHPENYAITRFFHDPSNANSLSHDHIWGMQQDRAGFLWIGTNGGGVNRFDPTTERFKRYLHRPGDPSSLSDNRIRHVFLDREGVLWIATRNGLNRYDEATDTFTQFLHDPEEGSTLSHNNVRVVFEDRSGELWVGTNSGGLNRYDRDSNTFEWFLNDPYDSNSLSHNSVIDVYEDPFHDGVLWVGTWSGGLNRFDVSTRDFSYATQQNSSFPNNMIRGITSDRQGNVWVATNGGLASFRPSSETIAYRMDFRSVASLNGMPLRGLNDIHRTDSGELLVGSMNGLTILNPDGIRANPHPPQVVLTDFTLTTPTADSREPSVLTLPMLATDMITLLHTQNDFSFDFVGLHFANPSGNTFAYMLESYDSGWRLVGAQRRATYTNLTPGRYTFRVKAANGDGLWNEEGASVRLWIRPPWWKTTWANLLYVLLIGSTIYGVVRWRVWSLERRNNALELLVTERTVKVQEQAKKLRTLDEMKSRFFANISHEFRTPLTLVLGPLEELIRKKEDDVEQPVFRMMHRNVKRLLSLINELLDVSKLEAGRMRLKASKRDLIPFLRRVVFSFTPMAERKQISLDFRPEHEHIEMFFDMEKLEKVIVNLLSNAFKFTPEHGKIHVSVELNEHPEQVAIRVFDTGTGIPADQLPHIFDRFFQVDSSVTRRVEGSGIGLALSRELIELHGGTLSAESKEGFGSVFTAQLLTGDAHLAESDIFLDERLESDDNAPYGDWVDSGEESPSRSEGPGEHAPTVLVIEDYEDMRAYVRQVLQPYYQVEVAEDGQSGLNKARTLMPDLIICDVMMPVMDGYTLCKTLKSDKSYRDIPIVLLTARASDKNKLEGLEVGADDYILKPFDTTELLARAENLIQIRRILREHYSQEVIVGPSRVSVKSSDVEFLEKVRDIVEEHMGDASFGVPELADKIFLSRRQLHRRIRAVTNLSTVGYIRMMRLERAAQYLAQHAGTVSQIAHRVGFQDANYFSRLFSQTYGISPTEYMENRPQ